MIARSLRYVAALLVLGCASVSGCFAGANDKVFCDQFQEAEGPCFNQKVYDNCIKCFDECGTVCETTGSCPEVFTCTPKVQTAAEE